MTNQKAIKRLTAKVDKAWMPMPELYEEGGEDVRR